MNSLRTLSSSESPRFSLFSCVRLVVPVLVAFAGGFPADAATVSLPSTTVSNVILTSPVVRATQNIAVAANAASTFDVSSGPTAVQTSCGNCSNADPICKANTLIKSKQVLTTTTIAVANQKTVLRAAPEFGMSDPTLAELIPDASNVYRGIMPAPTVAADGFHTVTVTAYVSEDVTTTTFTTTKYLGAGPSCSGAVISSIDTAPVSNMVSKFGSNSATGTYTLDINAPTVALRNTQAQTRITQGADKMVHNIISAGSAGTNYSLMDGVTGPNGYTSTGPAADKFGPSGKGDGIAPDRHNTVAVHVACDAPLGTYSIANQVNTVDLLSNAFDPIGVASSSDATFDVDQGLFLKNDTFVVSELPPTLDYAPMTCFNSIKTPQGKVNTFPGSLHITATVNTTGPCAGFGKITNPVITLSLPPDGSFTYADSGNSPKAHVFVGPANNGFDLHDPTKYDPHYPVSFQEVTSLIPKTDMSASGPTLTVDLKNLTIPGLNLGPGVVPADYTIFVRAHAAYTSTALPVDPTEYTFTTSTTAVLEGIGPTTDTTYQIVTAKAACVNGN